MRPRKKKSLHQRSKIHLAEFCPDQFFPFLAIIDKLFTYNHFQYFREKLSNRKKAQKE